MDYRSQQQNGKDSGGLPTGFREAFDLGRLGAPVVERPDGGKTVFAPKDTQAFQIAPLEQTLPRIAQKVVLHDKDSFLAYVAAFKTEKTRLFAEPGFLAGGTAHVTAVFDYHQNPTPEHCKHIAVYSPRYSDAWKRWMRAFDVGAFKQAEFAEFIEEVRADIREPNAATLLDIVRTFKASKRAEYDSLAYQPNGDVVLYNSEKTEQVSKSGPLPETMRLGIQIYFRGEAFDLPVFVRYRLNGGVVFSLKPDRWDIREDTAFTELATAIGGASGIAPFLGRMS